MDRIRHEGVRGAEQIQGCSERDDLHMSAVNKNYIDLWSPWPLLVGHAEDIFFYQHYYC